MICNIDKSETPSDIVFDVDSSPFKALVAVLVVNASMVLLRRFTALKHEAYQWIDLRVCVVRIIDMRR